jgi:hypothetical protein
MVHYRGGAAAIDPAVYATVDEFWTDLSAAYAEEVRRLGELGCTYLQLDDTSLAYLNDPAQRQMINDRGDDAQHQHLRYIKQINDALKSRPEGMTSPRTRAEAIFSPTGRRRVATTSSPKHSSVNSKLTDSSSSTTTTVRAASNRCDSFPRTRWSSSVSSRPRAASSNQRTT